MAGNIDAICSPHPSSSMQGMLDKAQQLNTIAREVFEFTARCCSTTTKCHGGRNGDGGKIDVGTAGGSKDGGNNGESNHPASPVKGCTATDTRVADGINKNVVTFSLSDRELNEGEALLFKIRRCTSAPTNPDDRAPQPKATEHPGVRHRVEVCRKVTLRTEAGYNTLDPLHSVLRWLFRLMSRP